MCAAQADEGSEFSQNYSLNVLWLDKSIGLAVDQAFKGVRASCTSQSRISWTDFTCAIMKATCVWLRAIAVSHEPLACSLAR